MGELAFCKCGTCFDQGKENVEILNVGFQNRDAGPDFFNAKVCINGVVQVGNVEIHQKGSDWFRHAHEKDTAYNNVILSVVGEADMEVYDSRGREIDAITLVYDNRLWDEYVFMQGVPVEPRCHRHLKQIDTARLDILFAGYAIERLETINVKIFKLCCGKPRMIGKNVFTGCWFAIGSGNVNADAFTPVGSKLVLQKSGSQ